jgi:S-adenosylmethionine:tRNA ribosyltransferase-isomerase
MKAGSRIQPGFRFKVPTLEQGFMAAEVVSRRDDPGGALFTARFEGDPVLETVGEVPLPPYIVEKRRAGGLDSRSAEEELSLYNTVYSKKDGSVAAPTAGRHFTPELIERLKRGGTGWCEITLHVGIGTFKPVSVPEVTDHRMHPETTEISEDASRELKEALRNGRRILAIGTTTARTLEARARVTPDGLEFDPGKQEVNLFIHPGLEYEWKSVDAILTNFHLPESTLLMMIASRIGDLGFTLDAYREAVRQGYRFYSYGDAMLVLDR